MQDLRTLAERYVRLSTELEETRRAMQTVLGDGHDPEPRPTRAISSRSGKAAYAARMAAAAAAETRMAELLKTKAMGQAELAKERAREWEQSWNACGVCASAGWSSRRTKSGAPSRTNRHPRRLA
jgi:hypothetical protein